MDTNQSTKLKFGWFVQGGPPPVISRVMGPLINGGKSMGNWGYNLTYRGFNSINNW